MARKKKWDKMYPIPYTHKNVEKVIDEDDSFYISTEIHRNYKYGVLCITQVIRFVKKGIFYKHKIQHPLIY
jgi:hypothetical protein